MQKNFGLRLKTQLIAVFTILLTVLMGLEGILTYKRVEAVVEQQSADITQQYFRQNEYNILNFTQEIDTALKLLTQVPSLQSYLESGWREDFDSVMCANAVFEAAAQTMSNYNYFESVYFYGDNGVVLGATPRRNMVVKRRDRSQFYYQSSIREKVLENPWETWWFGNYDSRNFELEKEREEAETIPYISVARSLNIRGKHTATIVLNMKKSVIADMIGYADEAHKRESFLVDENGIIVVHRNLERTGERFEGIWQEGETEENYYMEGDMQVNYRQLKGGVGIPWTLVSQVPISVLYSDIYSLRQWFVITVILGWLVAWAISSYWLYRLTKPLDELREGMRKMERGELGWQLEKGSRNELGILGRQFNVMSNSMQEMVGQIQSVEQEKRLLEQEALQAQINPHFLFNTLTNIKYMAMIVKSDTIVECITALGNFLSPIYRSDGDAWRIEQEMTYIGNYIKIMNYRFGGRIKLILDCEEEMKMGQILKFILQPLVENAISHGFEEREGEGCITIRFREMERQLVIRVEDDGCGMPAEQLRELRQRLVAGRGTGSIRKGHIGMLNVHRRLQLYFGGEYGLTIDSMDTAGTAVTVHMPLQWEYDRK